MSKNMKTVLIVAGILSFVSIACVGGVFLTGYFFLDNKGIDEGIKQGKEFGQTTDNLGCQTKIVSMIQTIGDTDINEMLKAQYFFESCLKISQPTPSFCDGMANPFSDILNHDKAKVAECTKIGLEGSIPCRQIIEKKLDFCMSKN